MSRIARPRLELQTELREQLALLRHACQAYDGGLEAIAKHISVSLRVLLHHVERFCTVRFSVLPLVLLLFW